MTATIESPRAELRNALAAVLGVDELPEFATAAWICQSFGVADASVYGAIRSGKLPSVQVPSGGATFIYLVRPEDALVIWGHRLTNRP